MKTNLTSSVSLPETGFLRLSQIIPSIFPISKAAWYQGVKEGRYPSPVRLSARVAGYRVEDIRALIARLAA
jgi:predicted DNA-binding transcriptional regulator AlpA